MVVYVDRNLKVRGSRSLLISHDGERTIYLLVENKTLIVKVDESLVKKENAEGGVVSLLLFKDNKYLRVDVDIRFKARSGGWIEKDHEVLTEEGLEELRKAHGNPDEMYVVLERGGKELILPL